MSMRDTSDIRVACGSDGVAGSDVPDESGPERPKGHTAAPDLEESIVVDTKDLIQMLQSPGEEPEAAEDEGNEDDSEECDLVMDLDYRFKNADVKRKYSEVMIEEARNGRSAQSSTEAGAAAASEDVAGNQAVGAADTTRASPKYIKTVVRVRPLPAVAGELSLTVKGTSTILTTNPITRSRGDGYGAGRSGSRLFEYSKVLDESTPQQRVFNETARPFVDGLFESPGRSGLVVAYGATNAGKTHTVMGPQDQGGVLLRALEEVYTRLRGTSRAGEDEGCASPVMRLRVVEVYKDKAYDLLRATDERGAPLSFKQIDGGDEIVGISDHYPEDLGAALKLVQRARSRALVAPTALNATSSRGHTVWMIELRQGSQDGDDARSSRARAPRGPMLWIADLAGSERINRSMSHIKEAMHINMDTSALFTCLKQVEAGSQHVSWRGRILTRMLKTMLVREAGIGQARNRFGWRGGASSASASMPPRYACVMIVNVNPAASEYGETQKVLTNALISKNARLVEEVARAGGDQIVVYGMDGHLIKRPKHSHPTAESRSPAVCRRQEARHSATGSAAAEQSMAVKNQQALIVKDQAREITRLEGQVAQLQEELDMMQEVAWNEAQQELQQELFPQIEDLEIALRLERDKTRDLEARLSKAEPVGATASRAESVRKQATEGARRRAVEGVGIFFEQQAVNIQEAEDEIRREQEQKAHVEGALAKALAERDAQALRASALSAEGVAVRAALEESRLDALRLADEVARLATALAHEKARADALDATSVDLRNQLDATKAQKVDTEGGNLRHDNCLVLRSDDGSIASYSDELPQPRPEGRKSGRQEELHAPPIQMPSTESSPESGGSRMKAELFGASLQRRSSSSEVMPCQDGATSFPSAQHLSVDPQPCLVNGFRPHDGRKPDLASAETRTDPQAVHHPHQGKGRSIAEPLVKTKRSVRCARKPLGDLQPPADDGNVGLPFKTAQKAPASDETSKDTRQRVCDYSTEPDGDGEGVENASPHPKAGRAKGDAKTSRLRDEKAEKAAQSREETRRCRALRDKGMLSKPPPEIVPVTRRQEAIAKKANEIVRARRSGRRRR